MEKIKSLFNALYALVWIVVSVFSRLIYFTGYAYRPKSFLLYVAMLLLLLVFATIFSVRNRQKASRVSKVFAGLMPIIVFLHFILAPDLLVVKSASDKWLLIAFTLLFGVEMASAFVIFFTHITAAWLTVPTFFIAMLMALFYVFGCFMTCFVVMILPKEEILHEVHSPNNTYIARVIRMDGGAMGGSRRVEVQKSRKITLLFGTIVPRPETVWNGRYSDTVTISWRDEETFSVNGKPFHVNAE